MPASPDVLNKVFGLSHMDTYHDYGDFLGNVRYYHRLKAVICRDFILKEASQNKVFLDAGAGRGPYTYLGLGLYKLIYCYEYDAQELNAAKQNVGAQPEVRYGQVDLTQIPLPDGVVDVVVCSEVLEHIPNYQKAMAELYRVLKPGGKMLFSMPNSQSLFYWNVRRVYKSLIKKNKKALSHSEWEFLRHLEFNSSNIEAIAEKEGFKIQNRNGANLIPLPSSFRKILMNLPWLFKIFVLVSRFFSRIFPRYCSFYFIELKK